MISLTEEELADCAVQMSAASFAIQRIQDQKKEADKRFKTRIDEQLEELKGLSEKVRDGHLKEVDAVEIYDFKKGKVRTIQAGTDHVISERDMTERDRQLRLDDATPEETPAEPEAEEGTGVPKDEEASLESLGEAAAETGEEVIEEVPQDEETSLDSSEEETAEETGEETVSEASQDEEASPQYSEEGGKEKGKNARSIFRKFLG